MINCTNLFTYNPYVNFGYSGYPGVNFNPYSIFGGSMPMIMPMMMPMMFPQMNFNTQQSAAKTNGTNEAKSQGNEVTNPTKAPADASGARAQMVAKAKSYVGKVNSSAEGNRLFSPKGYQNTGWYRKYGRWGWCCDFAVSCAKDTLGSKYPKDMITSSPGGLAKKAEKHDAYLKVPSTNKSSWLSANIKPGDIIYMKGSGDSGKHIAVVESIGSNGEIKAVSGNSGGKVKNAKYNINSSGIYGFVSLGKLAA